MTTHDPIAALALNHNVPEPITYTGQYFIPLSIDPEVFGEAAVEDYAVRLPGTGYLTIDDETSIGQLDAWTFECWVKPPQFRSNSYYEPIIGIKTSSLPQPDTENGFMLKVGRDWTRVIHPQNPQNQKFQNFTVNLQPNVWSHLAYTCQTGERGRLYLNGTSLGEVFSWYGSIELTDIQIGRSIGGPEFSTQPANPRFFHGEIDQIRLWDAKLTDEQVQLLPEVSAISQMPFEPIFSFDLNQGVGDAVPNGSTRSDSVLHLHGAEWHPSSRNDQFRPEIALVETYRISNFRGAYGPGRIVNTFSLLPGEETEISISTFNKTSESTSQTSSVLDSTSQKTSNDYGQAIEAEANKSNSESRDLNFTAGVEGSVSGPVFSATASASVSVDTNSKRESLAKNISNVTAAHAAEASSQRNVEVNTSMEARTEIEERSEIVRRVKNINLGRTLNFVFRQMNQEYITLVHLVDIDIAYRRRGRVVPARIVPLTELADLLDDVIVETSRLDVRNRVVKEIADVRDLYGKLATRPSAKPPISFLDPPEPSEDPDQFYRVNRRYTSTYSDVATGTTFEVPGVLIEASSVVMRTDHVYVDSFLGEGEALDPYSRGLQDEAVEASQVENRRTREEVLSSSQVRSIQREAIERIAAGDPTGVAMLQAIGGLPPTMVDDSDANDDDAATRRHNKR